MELVTGATGYVGGLLLARLVRDERPVRALARDPDRLSSDPSVDLVRAELLSGEGLERALDGIATAYYLVHSLEDPPAGSERRHSVFADSDRRAADNFARAAAAAGVERIVYLGGIVPADGAPSRHLASRLEVERVLLDAVPRSTALRASIMVGAGSSSFRILVRLVERLRVLPMPAWRRRRTRPIDERDAIEYLARTPVVAAAEGQSLDVAGRDVLSYARMVERIAELMGIGRAGVPLPVSLTPAASPVVSALTGQPLGLVRPLMESLEHDLLPRDDSAADLYGIRPRAYDGAVERALRLWEEREPLAAR